jgi:hypothetical protein
MSVTSTNIFKKLQYILQILERIRNLDCQEELEEERTSHYKEVEELFVYLVNGTGEDPVRADIHHKLLIIINNYEKLLNSNCDEKYEARMSLYRKIRDKILELLDVVHLTVEEEKKVKISSSAITRKAGLACKNGLGRPRKQIDNINFILQNYNKKNVIDGCNNISYITYDFENRQYCCSNRPHTEEEMIKFLFFVLESSIKKTNNESKTDLLNLINDKFNYFIRLIKSDKQYALKKEYTDLYNYVIENDREIDREKRTVSGYELTEEEEDRINKNVNASLTPRKPKAVVNSLRRKMIENTD